jgi:hypothetical protein
MNRKTIRFFHALLVALTLMVAAAGPANAQSSPPPVFEPVRLLMKDGWTALGRHAVADDFILVCPTEEVLDPTHPCSETNAQAQLGRADDFVLVCPVDDVLDPTHPCYSRKAQIIGATPDDFVLVCPVKEVLDPNHPCGKKKSGAVQFEIPKDFVLTCPVKEVLEHGHPCAESTSTGADRFILSSPIAIQNDAPSIQR